MNNKHFPKFLHSNQLRKNKKIPQSNTCLNVGLCLETKSMMHNSLSSLTFIYIYIYMHELLHWGWGGGNNVSLRN